MVIYLSIYLEMTTVKPLLRKQPHLEAELAPQLALEASSTKRLAAQFVVALMRLGNC